MKNIKRIGVLQDLLVAELACSLCRLFWSIWRKWNSTYKLNMSKGNKVMLVVDIRWAEMCVNWYWLEVLCAWLKIKNSESKTQKTCPAVTPSPYCQHVLTARRLCMCVGGGTGQIPGGCRWMQEVFQLKSQAKLTLTYIYIYILTSMLYGILQLFFLKKK